MIYLSKNKSDSNSAPLILNGLLAILILINGCVIEGSSDFSTQQETTATQIYNQFYTLKTNSIAAQTKNECQLVCDSGSHRAFFENLHRIDPSIQSRFEFDPFVTGLFLVDPLDTGQCYGCQTNTVFQQIGENPITNAYSRGMAWIIPTGRKSDQAILIMSSVGPKQTSIVLFDYNLNGHLLYDSYIKPSLSSIDYLCGIEVVDKKHFLLHEGWIPSISQVSLSPRTFILTIHDNGKIEIAP